MQQKVDKLVEQIQFLGIIFLLRSLISYFLF